jgi:hypothetical protein
MRVRCVGVEKKVQLAAQQAGLHRRSHLASFKAAWYLARAAMPRGRRSSAQGQSNVLVYELAKLHDRVDCVAAKRSERRVHLREQSEDKGNGGPFGRDVHHQAAHLLELGPAEHGYEPWFHVLPTALVQAMTQEPTEDTRR